VSQGFTKRAVDVELAFFLPENFFLLRLDLHNLIENLSVETIFSLIHSYSITTHIKQSLAFNRFLACEGLSQNFAALSKIALLQASELDLLFRYLLQVSYQFRHNLLHFLLALLLQYSFFGVVPQMSQTVPNLGYFGNRVSDSFDVTVLSALVRFL